MTTTQAQTTAPAATAGVGSIATACAIIATAALTILAGLALVDYMPKDVSVGASRSACQSLLANGADMAKIQVNAFSCQITDAQLSSGRISVKVADGRMILGAGDVGMIAVKK